MPPTDTIDFEREFEELVHQLRAIPATAPDSVREQVRALGEPPERRSIPWRRSLMVLAPACVLALFAAAAIHGVVESGQKEPQRQSLAPERARLNPPVGAPAFDSGSGLPAPNPNRHQDYEAWMRVRVKDLDALTDSTNEAMQVVRSYGGYVASVQQTTSTGKPGQADLVLRIPVNRVDDALVRLSQLGTVLDRHLSITDLEQVLRQQQRRIAQLKIQIARLTEALQGDLPADVRVRLQLQLEQARADLARATNARKATLDEAAFARISMTLTTQRAVAPVAKEGAGRFERAVREAGSFLARAGAVALFLLIVLSPFILLGAAGWWGTRAYRRREERRLLAGT
jgi:Domain of unknown function (DUF4349)